MKDLQTQPGTQCLTQAEDLPASDKSKLQFRPSTEEPAELLDSVFIEKSLHVSKWLQRGKLQCFWALLSFQKVLSCGRRC